MLQMPELFATCKGVEKGRTGMGGADLTAEQANCQQASLSSVYVCVCVLNEIIVALGGLSICRLTLPQLEIAVRTDTYLIDTFTCYKILQDLRLPLPLADSYALL